jgi:hypothetical protein
LVLSARSLRHTLPFAVLALLAGCSSTNGLGTELGDGSVDGAQTSDAKARDAKPGFDATKDARPRGEGGSPNDAVSQPDTDPGIESGSNDAAMDAGIGDAGMDAHETDGGHDSGLMDAGHDASAIPLGPAAVNLGTAGDYVVLAMSAISNAPISAITGNLGLSPAAASYITGFSMTRAGTKWTSAQVTGALFAADNDPPTPTNLGVAVGDMTAAYTDAAGRPPPNVLNDGAGAIGGLILAPGLYKWTSSVTILTNVVIKGAPDDTWIFQITGNLTMAAAKRVTLMGGATAKNIVWQVAGDVDFGTTSHAEGIVLCKNAITLETGASINGRLLSQKAVNLAGNTIVTPAP